jgi:hypothetical protein
LPVVPLVDATVGVGLLAGLGYPTLKDGENGSILLGALFAFPFLLSMGYGLIATQHCRDYHRGPPYPAR